MPPCGRFPWILAIRHLGGRLWRLLLDSVDKRAVRAEERRDEPLRLKCCRAGSLACPDGLKSIVRANLPREFFRVFTSRLTSGNQGDAFRQASLSIAADLQSGISALRDLCAQPEPLKAIGEFPSVASIKRDIQILNAQYRAFPYIGRGEEIDKLVAWLNGPEPASFFVIAGGAGDGKTRLGFQLLEVLRATQPGVWRAGWLATRRAGEGLRNERFRKWRGAQPTLIVIDYAASMSEALRDNVVRELAEEPAESRSDLPPLRILLLEREADEMRGWYDTLIRAAGDRAPELFPHSVLRLSKLDDTQRRDLFGAVLAAAQAARHSV